MNDDWDVELGADIRKRWQERLFIGFLLALVIAFVAMIDRARAHGWYESACCHDRDCHPAAVDDDIRETRNGWAVNGRLVPYDKVKQSRDGQFHFCEHSTPGQVVPDILCLYVPMSF